MSNPPFKVKAVYDYTSPHDDDLHFSASQIITVVEEEDDDWYAGEYVDAEGVKQEGIFPRNFVEKYEPTAPPRPTRSARPKKEAESPMTTEASAPESMIVSEPAPVPQAAEPSATVPKPASKPAPNMDPAPAAPAPAVVSPEAPRHVVEPEKQAAIAKPAVAASEPSVGGSFRDRIAAFNKAAPPMAPFKPSGLGSGGSTNFIKKPFVAPPPSKNAYVPTAPREAPVQKIYRREEDPEIQARQNEDLELAERAGLAPTSPDGDQEDQPKPTSLKERIALLQKQQMEQAQRHAEAAAKKEKPKKPAKKKPESHSQETEAGDAAANERKSMDESAMRASTDSMRDDAAEPRRRRSVKASTTPSLQPRASFGDGNEADLSGAGDTTEDQAESTVEESNEAPRHQAAPSRQADVGDEEGAVDEPAQPGIEEEEEEEEDDEQDDIDPEVRRKEELRARMAKMSAGMGMPGMGMHGMFGAPMPMPGGPPLRKKSTIERPTTSSEDVETSAARAPPVPMIPMPGMSRVKSPEEMEHVREVATRPFDEVPDDNGVAQVSSPDAEAAPLSARGAPPPIPNDTRPIVPSSPRSAAESDADQTIPEAPIHPVTATPLSSGRRTSHMTSDEATPSSPSPPSSRPTKAPPVPGQVTRGVPPPPPPQGEGRTSISSRPHAPEEIEEEEVTAYEGDYDTDIAPTASHKDALKASEEPVSRSPPLVQSPPLPASRHAPPPLPSLPPPSRRSSEVPRAAPPPPPPSAKLPAPYETNDDEYDPYKFPPPSAAVGAPTHTVARHSVTQHSVPKPGAVGGEDDDDMYSASPPRSYSLPLQERGAAPAPPREAAAAAAAPPARDTTAAPGRSLGRQSLDRTGTVNRRSMELSRMSMDSGHAANDIDLGHASAWWTKQNGVPPVLYNRRDVLFESEESQSQENHRVIITRDLFVLYTDYSQTIITARYHAHDATAARLEQRHEHPPPRLRQDQLEQAYERFGRRIAEAVSGKKEGIVGDGTPHGLIVELLRPLPDALLPVGTRAYGALVYANLANASTTQNDEIRAGDIMTLRNARFQGKHGAMHAKYSVEVGKPDHVGVVGEWDGTKKKVRAWEQGRESKKVKLESFKLDDLRSGEVKIWRVMPRSWVGWSGVN